MTLEILPAPIFFVLRSFLLVEHTRMDLMINISNSFRNISEKNWTYFYVWFLLYFCERCEHVKTHETLEYQLMFIDSIWDISMTTSWRIATIY